MGCDPAYPASKLTGGSDASLPTLPEEREPAEDPPGWKVKTDRVREVISEGFRLAETERVGPRCTEAVSLWLFDIREFESTGSLAGCEKTIVARWKLNAPHI